MLELFDKVFLLAGSFVLTAMGTLILIIAYKILKGDKWPKDKT